MTLSNRMVEAAKFEDADIQRAYASVIDTVKSFYNKPVLVTVLVSLEDGDVFDYAVAGDHTADGIQWIGNSLDFARRLDTCKKIRLAAEKQRSGTASPIVKPDAIPQDQWENFPPEMQQVLSDAAAEGRLTIMGAAPAEAPGGSADPLADPMADKVKGLDE